LEDFMRNFMLLAVSAVFVASCGKKTPAGPIIIEGWHQEEGAKAECYYPPKFTDSDRVTQSAVREAMMSQWRGEHGEDIKFSTSVIESVETVLLGKPIAVKGVAATNLDYCRKYAAGGSLDDWKSWFAGLKSGLTQGDCKWAPLRYQQHDYLNIGAGWHFPGRVCKGDTVRIEVSALDSYKLSDDSPWITAEGDTEQRAVGAEYPCTVEGCNVGMVVYRFTGEDGSISYGPVGHEVIFEAMQNGELHLRVNEAGDTFFDNTWRKRGSLIDHAAVAYVGLDE
jgi:hypothetical protein